MADVGGTNTRLALFEPSDQSLRHVARYHNRDFSHFEDLISKWLSQLDETPPDSACFAIAAPPGGDRISMTNMDWSFSCRELTQSFGFQHVRWINDFQSNAYALPYLSHSERLVLQPGQGPAQGESLQLAVIGPGTGLGGAILRSQGGEHLACAGEPGHMALSPANEEELELFKLLLTKHDNIYAELLLSGPGLERLYHTLAQLRGQAIEAGSAIEISQRAMAASDPLCQASLNTFCALLGSICGDFVLATGSYDGLYLAGGIVPKILSFLQQSPFRARFAAKGAMQAQLLDTAIYAISAEYPGLIGAAHAPMLP